VPLIIFDSYDCAGKTTLLNEFIKKTKYPISESFLNQRPKFKNPDENYLWSKAWHYGILGILKSCDINLVVDRFIMSEYCYSIVLRGYKIDYFDDYIKELKKCKTRVTWVYPTLNNSNWLKELKRRYTDKKEDYISFNKLLSVKKMYDSLFRSFSLTKIKINTMESIDKCIDRLTGELS